MYNSTGARQALAEISVTLGRRSRTASFALRLAIRALPAHRTYCHGQHARGPAEQAAGRGRSLHGSHQAGGRQAIAQHFGPTPPVIGQPGRTGRARPQAQMFAHEIVVYEVAAEPQL